jgi:hypothetical protein
MLIRLPLLLKLPRQQLVVLVSRAFQLLINGELFLLRGERRALRALLHIRIAGVGQLDQLRHPGF